MSAEPLLTLADGFSGPYDRALRRGTGTLELRGLDGELLTTLDVARFCAPADAADLDALSRTRGSVLDLGCGPGRLVLAALRSGRPALGVDSSRTAVTVARRAGSPALRRDVFGPLPGGWGTVVLLDGNVGIGGDPRDLLRRSAELLAPGGRILVECHPEPALDQVRTVRLHDVVGVSDPFPWALVGVDALRDHLRGSGLRIGARWVRDGRGFALLTSGVGDR